jgi:hypothetical protein
VLKTTGLPVDQIIPNPDALGAMLSGLGAAGGDPRQIAQLIAGMSGGTQAGGNALLTGSSQSPALDGRSAVPPAQGSLPPPQAPTAKPMQSALPVNSPA